MPADSAAGGQQSHFDPKTNAEVLAGLRRQPRPEYPTAARNDGLEGHGVCLIHFDTATGKARDVIVTESSGEEILD